MEYQKNLNPLFTALRRVAFMESNEKAFTQESCMCPKTCASRGTIVRKPALTQLNRLAEIFACTCLTGLLEGEEDAAIAL